MRPAELHSLSAEENCLIENVASLRSVKVATPLVPLKRLSPVDLKKPPYVLIHTEVLLSYDHPPIACGGCFSVIVYFNIAANNLCAFIDANTAVNGQLEIMCAAPFVSGNIFIIRRSCAVGTVNALSGLFFRIAINLHYPFHTIIKHPAY